MLIAHAHSARLARMSDGPCPDCGGERVSASCSSEMHLMRGGPAIRWPLTDLRAALCTGCGRVALYANDLDKVREAVRKHPRDFQR
jgi:hypothetical protein